MLKRFIKFARKENTLGISPYIWIILGILPFYFIYQSSTSTVETVIGVILTILFFILYRIAFLSRGRWIVYIWAFILMGISITSTSLFSYVYFAFFLAHFIGNIRERITFFILYFVHLLSTSISINISIIQNKEIIIQQLPFVVVIWFSVILLPFTIHNKNERGHLEEKLEDAYKRITELGKLEERQRIARDLHDILGQKLSLIGLKSDLARKLIHKNPDQAREELKDVQQTARTALNEVRKLVSSMRGIRFKDEIVLVKQVLDAAEIQNEINLKNKLTHASLLTENILSMCLKESVTNVVKHSGATSCSITIEQTWKDIIMIIRDNGMFKTPKNDATKGHGIEGMKERLEFVNGNLEIKKGTGTTIVIRIPNDVKKTD